MTKQYCMCNNKYHDTNLHDKLCTGDGPEDARVMFIGLAPGYEEAQQGKYFVGPSGKHLRRDIVGAGIPTDQIRFENVAQYWPKKHSLNSLTNEKRESGRRALMDAIQRIRPDIIVPLGDEALKEITGENRITKWRGSKLRLAEEYRAKESQYNPVVLPTVHPSGLY